MYVHVQCMCVMYIQNTIAYSTFQERESPIDTSQQGSKHLGIKLTFLHIQLLPKIRTMSRMQLIQSQIIIKLNSMHPPELDYLRY